jgi:CheY-like chemotaxis protein
VGSTFTVHLPRIAAAADVEDHTLAMQPAALTGSETVLVAEDEEVVRRLIAQTLGRLGYTVLIAENGAVAIDVLANAEVDLVLTDVVMPGKGGRELAAWVRKHRPGTRVVFMSGYDSGGGDGEPLDGPLLEKPFTAASLGAQVRAALDAA